MTFIRILSRFALLAGLISLVGCATPPEVKQALVSLDQGYTDNAKLMRQYQQLSEGFAERHRVWTLYVENRALLDLALLWATTDPESGNSKMSAGAYVDRSRTDLGPEVLELVNKSRLKGLPARASTNDAEIVFRQGTNTTDALIQNLPDLVNRITKRTAANYDAAVKHDGSPFADYDAQIAALRRMNDAIKRYLDIDVTVKPADVKDIADSIRTLADK